MLNALFSINNKPMTLDFGSEGWGFESLQVYQPLPFLNLHKRQICAARTADLLLAKEAEPTTSLSQLDLPFASPPTRSSPSPLEPSR